MPRALWKCMLSLLVVFMLLPLPNAAAQEETMTPAAIEGRYEPSPAYPFGRLNPDAPPETAQFAFILGAHDCVERIFNQQDGSWKEVSKRWNGRAFLNGYAIRDDTWRSDGVYTTNIRTYDATEGKWVVTFFSHTSVSPQVWEGGKEGETVVVRQDGETAQGPFTSRLTFYDISETGFEWKMDIVTGNGQVLPWWTSSCTKQR